MLQRWVLPACTVIRTTMNCPWPQYEVRDDTYDTEHYSLMAFLCENDMTCGKQVVIE
jgi:hypothetical protein